MLDPHTCNPYFVKSLNLGTSTLTGDHEMTDSTTPIENFIEDEVLRSKLREAGVNTMEILGPRFHSNRLWYLKSGHYTYNEFRQIVGALNRFTGHPIENFMNDTDLISKFRRSGLCTMEILAPYFRSHQEMFENTQYYTVRQWRIIREAVDKFDGHEVTEDGMSELRTFLQVHHVNPNFANVLQHVLWVHNMQTLEQYLQKASKFVHDQVAYPHFGPSLSNWQKAIWNEVLDLSTCTLEDVEACRDFLRLCLQVNFNTLPFMKSGPFVSMEAFFRKNDIRNFSVFAKTLQRKKIQIASAQDLRHYINKTREELENRVAISDIPGSISDVTPFEQHLWDVLVTKETSQQDQEDALKFIKLATYLSRRHSYV